MRCNHADDCRCNVREECGHYITHDEGDDCCEPQECYWPQDETAIVKCIPATRDEVFDLLDLTYTEMGSRVSRQGAVADAIAALHDAAIQQERDKLYNTCKECSDRTALVELRVERDRWVMPKRDSETRTRCETPRWNLWPPCASSLRSNEPQDRLRGRP